jgi:hypothetical protein
MTTRRFSGARVWLGLFSLMSLWPFIACTASVGEATAETSAALITSCTRDAECPSGDYCALPSGADTMCGSKPGVCETKPSICPDDVVVGGYCGCDGLDYGNPCFAARAGVSIAYQGPCGASAGDLCGGPTAITCGAGLYCALDANEACGAVGTCTDRPERCPAYCTDTCRTCSGASVCNACYAARAGGTVSAESCPQP